jgi:hypothetical protein
MISLTLGLGVGVGAALEGLGDGVAVGPVVGISAPELELLGLSLPYVGVEIGVGDEVDGVGVGVGSMPSTEGTNPFCCSTASAALLA